MDEIFEIYGHAIISMIVSAAIVAIATFFFFAGPLAEKIFSGMQMYM